jgi:hypothetical protein
MRRYYSKWEKIWKKFRIYHQPYGIWMSQKNCPNKFNFEGEDALKNFDFKISKYTTKSKIQPVLEAKII